MTNEIFAELSGHIATARKWHDPEIERLAMLAAELQARMAATMTGQDHANIQVNNAIWLQWATSRPRPVVQGSIASGSSGGSSAPVVWSKVLPVVPAWVDSIDLFCSLPYTLTIPAGATVVVSPFFPYSSIQQRLTISGSPPWDQISLVPFWLDEMTRTENFDPSYYGPVPTAAGGAQQQDQGTWAFSTGNALVIPGNTIHNAGGVPEVVSGTATFIGRIKLQRGRTVTYGMIPNGDSDDRPDLELNLSPLIGPQPYNNAVQDFASSGATMVLSSAGTVNAVWNSKSLDQLPANVPNPGPPTVGLGWSINSFDTNPGASSGIIVPIPHRKAMLYQKIIHVVVNNQQVLDTDYFGNWLTGEQTNARWEYDGPGLNNMPAYWKMIQERYHRALPTGTFVADFTSGDVPDFPTATPYQAQMSPDESYATAFGIPFTPAMATALRYPTGTVMTTPNIHTYALGLVEVPY